MKRKSSKIRPEQSFLKEIFDYTSEGHLIRRIKTGRATKVGERAGNFNEGMGYRYICVNGANYSEHIIIWIWHYGKIPKGKEVDHKNRIRSDNRIENLRIGTHGKNSANIDIRKDNTSGYKGVSFHKRTKTWRADITFEDCQKSLGHFGTALDAAVAYNAAALKFQGEFAVLNKI